MNVLSESPVGYDERSRNSSSAAVGFFLVCLEAVSILVRPNRIKGIDTLLRANSRKVPLVFTADRRA
jgi:hypothetical protein